MTRSVETETKGLGLSKEFTTGSVETETKGLGLSKEFTTGSVETETEGLGLSKRGFLGYGRKSTTTIRVVPVLPDCATRPQDGPGAERERSAFA